ncbi:lipopolysaccharide kinase InaA family protein [Mangrovimonas xylaniphaga]|uniref:lipopolysaccharide kinase InaA family protein n=1 Tax=Mangrovimonas xylaniphaga TaxID=1645915 RepID=UPI0006B4D14C|nr:lipopolysaccharide kinase InaA family protein [Mangrovimonas xylaniphaga]
MPTKIVIDKNVNISKPILEEALQRFDSSGELIGTGYRNVIKTLDINGIHCNVKSFKVPNLINKIVYNFFRKSKAQRSFEYASKLQGMGIGTPDAVAYVEHKTPLFFKESYYISKQLEYDFTIRKLIDEPMCEDYERILREFTRFTYELHEKGVHFLDHSPGNTLIKQVDGEFQFYLVDLNRMRFEKMDLDMRLNNFARLSPKDYMLDIISDEYATLIGAPKEEIKEKMYFFSKKFSSGFKKKEAFKKKYFFWRKKKS